MRSRWETFAERMNAGFVIRPRWPQIVTTRTAVLGVVAGALLGALAVAGAQAVASNSHPARSRAEPIWNSLRFGGEQLLVVFAVDASGNVQPYYLQQVGKTAPYDPDMEPTLGEAGIVVKIGNPKVCWTTTGGGSECVVY